MKKLFTLFCVLLLWQSVAVAQNELHIWTGDSTKIVQIAKLDSVTVRDKLYYGDYMSWNYYATGVYEYTLAFSGNVRLNVYVRENLTDTTKRQFMLENWAFGVNLIIDYDTSSGLCRVQPQSTGYIHEQYGYIMVADLITYTGNETDEYISTFDEETGVFKLNMIYYVSEGYFGYGIEQMQLFMDSAANSRKQLANVSPALQGVRLRSIDALKARPGMSLRKDINSNKNFPLQMRPCPINPIIK